MCALRHVHFRLWQDETAGAHVPQSKKGTNVPRVKLTAARAAFLHGAFDEPFVELMARA
ncbi:hypothetical protein [Caballeronia zhejiangensis]|uniref:hypothetical protein n=1 Tax=Caballeronia zhejiangensis TaxID=871203 RepID=UPI001EF58DFA|nr:hypothetical protein [Caballeronia zhejiangensis]MCI1045898.1 hypothetical protein [Caballeronia zhejiangensis]